jgi:oxidase EvaA
MLVEASEETEHETVPSCRWAPLDELLRLTGMDFMVNTDARSVLVSSPWALLAQEDEPFARWRGTDGFEHDLWASYTAAARRSMHDDGEIEERLMEHRSNDSFRIREIGLEYDRDWVEGRIEYLSGPGDSFRVRQFDIRTTDREVEHWDQPLVASTREGDCTLLARRIGGVLHFLFRCRAEVGFRERVQLGPTIQTGDGAVELYPGSSALDRQLDELLGSARALVSCRQSDEGGRFYHSVSDYSIVLMDDSTEIPNHESFVWMTLAQIERFAAREGFMSNEARSLASLFLQYL